MVFHRTGNNSLRGGKSIMDTNILTAGKYSDVHFRIRKNGYDGSGHTEWNTEQREKYCTEVETIFISHGWIINKGRECDCVAATATKGKSSLYLHPQDFSGVCENTERERLFASFHDAVTFECELVNIYKEVFNMSDEQLIEKLERERDIIKQEILEVLTTKRKNLYICDTGYYGMCGNIGIEHAVKRLAIEGKSSFNGIDDTTEGICVTFANNIFQKLIEYGKIVSGNTKYGIGYRTAKPDELKASRLHSADEEITEVLLV